MAIRAVKMQTVVLKNLFFANENEEKQRKKQVKMHKKDNQNTKKTKKYIKNKKWHTFCTLYK